MANERPQGKLAKAKSAGRCTAAAALALAPVPLPCWDDSSRELGGERIAAERPFAFGRDEERRREEREDVLSCY